MFIKKYKESCKILNITLEQSLNDNVLKSTFKSLAIKHHPDKGGNEDTFKNINSAHEYIKNYQKDYINYLNNPIDNSFNEFVESVMDFSTSKKMKKRSSVDITIDMDLSLEELNDSFKNMVMYTRRISCSDCKNSGCVNCNNIGVLYQDIMLELNITSEVMDFNGNLIYYTYGDQIKNLPMGNLIIKPVYKKEEKFWLETVDNDYPIVLSEVKIHSSDANSKLVVDTLNGKVKITLPEKIKNNQKVRIKGKGLQFKNKKGDHYLILKTI
jgi:DnaJ-class molecular chaperone